MELSVRLWPLQIDQCGKDTQHHNDYECPSQTRSTQHAVSNHVQYDGYIVQSIRSLHTKAMCRCGCRNQQMGQKGTLFIYNIGSGDKHSLYALNINAQATNVW